MRFGPWYPLVDARDHVPAGEGVLQLRLARGLRDYPRGKSAMVHYAHAVDLPAAARDLGEIHAGRDLWCRHLIEIEDATDLGAWCAKLRAEFVRRFGAQPGLEPS